MLKKLSLLTVSSKKRVNNCSAGISGENSCKLAVKIMAMAIRIVLFGLRYFVGEISVSSLVLLLTTRGPRI